eukprot:TRINITY_DN111514_c0_g1_i1.p1 TRINITY_DN111514_c0_g1~~TRINITY_DN111514_c0_g1_i1.p1  ORF type:complete len:203 (-),score=38.77 TRINITY_DN111514_c0_g1_i1:7-615(-)
MATFPCHAPFGGQLQRPMTRRRSARCHCTAFLLVPVICALAPRAFLWTTGVCGRRLAILPASAVLLASSSAEADATRLDGSYDAPSSVCGATICSVTIDAYDGGAKISGKDGDGKRWKLTAKTEGNKIAADFSSIGGPQSLKGAYFFEDGEKGIRWEDGSVWEKMLYKTSEVDDVVTAFQREKEYGEALASGAIKLETLKSK